MIIGKRDYIATCLNEEHSVKLLILLNESEKEVVSYDTIK